MEAFRYKHGDRPLEGYTIQRAVGRGGFGEVYYAMSDGGREVALKVVQTYEQIELRGVSQCMNLKSPYLVTIFDVKHNEQDLPFVIMEYVVGPSLRELLNDSPSGIGTQKAAFFLRELAKGLTFLHDRGIVHRDLKPGNIFYEDGYVKIGDYGLSKAISASQHSAQTITVGTVHYMAPEIGRGQYDRSIDIYALGVVLFEMLTGQVPFFGASHGEILMKHLTTEPDLSGVEEPFATVIRKAMAKEPADRYQSVQEMVEAVFGAEHIQQSVSHFRPDSLSMVAQRVAQKATVGGPGSSADAVRGLDAGHAPGEGSSQAWQGLGQKLDRVSQRLDAAGERIVQAGTRAHHRFAGHREPPPPVPDADSRQAIAVATDDALDAHQRRVLWLITASVMGIGTGALSAVDQGPGVVMNAGLAISAIIGASAGVLATRDRFLPGLQAEPGLTRRLVFGGAACVGAFLGTAIIWFIAEVVDLTDINPDALASTFLPIFIGLLIIDWIHRASINRAERVSLGQAIGAGLLGFVLNLIFNASTAEAVLIIGILAGVSMAVQVASPFSPRGAGRPHSAARHQRRAGAAAAVPPAGGPPPPAPPAQPPPVGTHQPRYAPYAPARPPGRPVPAVIRMLWLVASVGLLGLGLMLLIWAGMELRGDDFGLAVAFGLGSLMFSLLCLVKALQSTLRSWWGSLIKPVLMLLCVQAVFTSAMYMATDRNLDGDETLVCLFWVIFPIILFIIIAAVPNRAIHALIGKTPTPSPAQPVGVSPKQRMWALLLAVLLFLVPAAGLHRFYVGKIGTGFLWLFTFGFLYIGQIVDIVLIAAGQFKDKWGRPLLIWQNASELERRMPGAAPSRPDAVARVPAADAASPHHSQQAAADAQDRPDDHHTTPPPPATGPIVVSPPRQTNLILAAPGGLLLLAGFAVGLFVAVDIPGIVAAGLPDPGLADELNRELGYTGWPKLFSDIGVALAAMLMLLATTILIVARRRAGGAHMVRAVLCVGMLAGALNALSESLRNINWYMIARTVENDQVGPAIEAFLGAIHDPTAAIAGVLLLLSIILLAWPPRRIDHVQSSPANEGA